MDPSQTHAQLVAMMRQTGLPMTTDNLNRAMEALARGEQLQPMPQTNGVDASIQRVMRPRNVPQRAMPTPPIPASAQPTAIATQQGANDASGGVPLTAAYNWAPPTNAGLPIDMILRDGIPIPRTYIQPDAQGPTWQQASEQLLQQAPPASIDPLKTYMQGAKYANQPPARFTRKTKREATKSE